MNSGFVANVHLKSSEDELKNKFDNLETFDDVSDLLEISGKHLRYILFEMEDKYKSFDIPKKNGETRSIDAPAKSIKILQKKLNYILSTNYNNRRTSHGFVKDRNIVTNASPHVGQNVVLNFDLKDFFNTINFGRVRGVFIKFFGIGEDAATVLANICCENNALPQGAPTSPVISNIVCYKLDKELSKLANKNSCVYTRYADDITISTEKDHFPEDIVCFKDQKAFLSNKLSDAVKNNGFIINHDKTRVRKRTERMEVTGLTVNEKVNVPRRYIRNIRAIIRSIEKYDLQGAQEILEEKYSKAYLKSVPRITDLVVGKLNYVKMVRGKEDPVFDKLAKRFNRVMNDELIETYKSEAELRELYTYVVECGFVIEGEFYPEEQGSGFFLDGVGFVTNAHVVERYINCASFDLPYIVKIHRSRYSSKTFEANSIKKYSRDLDIAVLDIEKAGISYGYNYDTHHELGDHIKIAGYPNHHVGDSLSTDSGELKQYRHHYLPTTINEETGEPGDFQERIVVSARIVDGNSGGPVLDLNNEVIGIAAKGFKTLTDSKEDEDTEASVVIKIRDVLELMEF